MAEEEFKSTTIKISDRTKDRLEHLKEHREESFDTIINKAVNILNVCVRSPSLASRILKDIENSKKRKELLENPDKMIKKQQKQIQPIIETQSSRMQKQIPRQFQKSLIKPIQKKTF